MEKLTEKQITVLKRALDVSNTAFEVQGAVLDALGKYYIPTKMHQLHKIAREEINKNEPDMELIYKLLDEIESLTKSNKKED